jgi:hypothetical protein
MGIEIPGAVEWLVPIVVGADWPEGDETALRRLGEAWAQAASVVGEVVQDGNGASTAAMGCMTGATAEAFDKYWKQFVEGEAYLVELQKLCEDLGAGCDDAALNIEYTKLSIIAALIILAAQIVALIASAVATFGASTAGVPIAQAATRVTVQMFFRELIKQIAINVVINVGIDLGIQLGQAFAGNRKSWDATKTLDAGISGVAAGIASGAMGSLSKSVGNASSNFLQAAGRGAVEGAVAGAGGNIMNNWAHGKFGLEDTLKGAMSGAASGSVGGAVGGMSTRHEGLSNTWANGTSPDGSTTSGANTQGHTFTTPDGATTRANVPEGTNPYNAGWGSTRAGNIPSDGGPNNVNDARDDDYEVRTSANPPRMVGNLDLPDAPPPKK